MSNSWSQQVFLPQPEVITDQQGLPQAFVPALVQDRQGFIWVATRDGLCRYDGKQFKIFRSSLNKSGLSSAGLTNILLDKSGILWVSSEQNDLDRFDPKTETVTRISKLPAFQKALGTHNLGPFLVDQHQRLWLSTSNGLFFINLRNNHIQQPIRLDSLASTSQITRFAEGSDGRIWLATNHSLAYFDETSQTIRSYPWPTPLPHENAEIGGLFVHPKGDILVAFQHHLMVIKPTAATGKLYSLPATGNEWWDVNFTVDQQGAVFFDQNTLLYRFTDQSGPTVLGQWTGKGEQCASLFVDASNVLWIGTDGAGIRKYDLRQNPFRAVPYRRSFRYDLISKGWLGKPINTFSDWNNLHKLDNYLFRSTIDGQGTCWFSIGGPTVYKLARQSDQVEKFSLPVPQLTGNVQNHPCPLTTDPKGQTWALYDSLIYRFDQGAGKWIAATYHLPRSQTGPVQLMLVDDRYVWFATETKGLFRLDRATERIQQYRYQENDNSSLSSNTLFSLASDPWHSDRLWVGTYGGGICVFDKKSGHCRRLTITDGLPNQVIYSLIPDSQGFIWAGTNKGICRINSRTFNIQTYTQQDGLLANEFNRFHYLQRPDGLIVMGGLTGITAFYPNQFRDDPYQPRTEITSLQIHNKRIEPGPNSPLGLLPIQAIKQLTLPHDQNFLTIGFAALQFNRPDKNRYRYQLIGLNPNWIESDQSVAVYTDLRPGSYTLLLNATNTSGDWSPYVRSIAITVRPPLWATWWAYGVYGLLMIGLALAGVRSYSRRLQLRQAVIMQQKEMEFSQREAAQLKAIDEVKTQFFANITHEFRTPLTLILSPIQQLLTETQNEQRHRRLSIIESNAHRLLQLVNQLMDLAKLEANAMSVQESVGDIGTCLEEWIGLFAQQAKDKQIEMAFHNHLTGSYWFDAAKLERIVTNLPANALKFTPRNGHISISLDPMTKGNQPGICLTVSDSGIGIPAHQLPHIFGRFYQANQSNNPQVEDSATYYPQQTGIGIGLSLVNELVEIQGGTIQAESQENLGSSFIIWLPYRPATKNQAVAPTHASSPSLLLQKETNLLVVEDHPELGELIEQSLLESYQVHRASNGAVGLDMAYTLMPDLIISDVLMPELDGYTLCRTLKQDARTSHIPIVLLTAKSSVESRMEGLAQGADDYLTKPFLVPELRLRVQNLLENRLRVQQQVRASLIQTDQLTESLQSLAVDPFLQQLYEVVESNLDSASFTLDELTTRTGMSRSSFYRKVKALTGLNPNEVIRLYRLKRATQFLREGYSIAETAYRVGYETPSHFSKVFRDQYQLTPSQFVDNLEK